MSKSSDELFGRLALVVIVLIGYAIWSYYEFKLNPNGNHSEYLIRDHTYVVTGRDCLEGETTVYIQDVRKASKYSNKAELIVNDGASVYILSSEQLSFVVCGREQAVGRVWSVDNFWNDKEDQVHVRVYPGFSFVDMSEIYKGDLLSMESMIYFFRDQWLLVVFACLVTFWMLLVLSFEKWRTHFDEDVELDKGNAAVYIRQLGFCVMFAFGLSGLIMRGTGAFYQGLADLIVYGVVLGFLVCATRLSMTCFIWCAHCLTRNDLKMTRRSLLIIERLPYVNLERILRWV